MMIKILKIGNTIYENFNIKTSVPTAFDENGNPTQFEEKAILNLTLDELKEVVKDTLLWLQKQRLNNVLSAYSYNSFSDVMLYANKQNDPSQQEAKAILSWYLDYDSKIWDYIQNEIPKFTDLDSLYSIDIKAVEEDLYDRTKTALPE